MARHTIFEMKTRCPFCGVENDATSGLEPGTRPPVDDDITLCFGCGEWAVFDSCVTNGGLRKPTDAEYDKINGSQQMRRARRAWVLTKERENATRTVPAAGKDAP